MPCGLGGPLVVSPQASSVILVYPVYSDSMQGYLGSKSFTAAVSLHICCCFLGMPPPRPRHLTHQTNSFSSFLTLPRRQASDCTGQCVRGAAGHPRHPRLQIAQFFTHYQGSAPNGQAATRATSGETAEVAGGG